MSQVMHFSERPWSAYKSSDYSVEQWHSACLIHLHDGPPTSKGQCKLPVKTPNGALNRNGVHAAAAALAGARGGVHAASEQKSSAARVLVKFYRELNEKPPPSLLVHSLDDIYIEHYGTRGMRWGIRKRRDEVARAKQFRGSTDAKRAKKLTKRPVSSLSNKQLKAVNERMNLEQNYGRLNPGKVKKGQQALKAIIATGATATAIYKLAENPVIQRLVTEGKIVAAPKAKHFAVEAVTKGTRYVK